MSDASRGGQYGAGRDKRYSGTGSLSGSDDLDGGYGRYDKDGPLKEFTMVGGAVL